MVTRGLPILPLPHVARAVPELTRPSCLPPLFRGDEADVRLLLLSCFYGELCWAGGGVLIQSAWI